MRQLARPLSLGASAAGLLSDQSAPLFVGKPRAISQQPLASGQGLPAASAPTLPAAGGQGAAPATDAEVIAQANAARKVLLGSAISNIATLQQVVGRPDFILLKPLFQPTIDALARWMKIQPTFSNYKHLIGMVLEPMRQNLTIGAAVVRQPQTGPDCKKGGFAWANPGQPALGIRTCDAFFKTGPMCRRDVLVHEFFHLVGLGHGELSGKPSPSRADMTPAHAFNSADNFAQLASDVVTGQTDACPAGR